MLQDLRGPAQLKELTALLNCDQASDKLGRSGWSDGARTALADDLREAGTARNQETKNHEEPRVVVATGAGEKSQIVYSRQASERLPPSQGEWRPSPKTGERSSRAGGHRLTAPTTSPLTEPDVQISSIRLFKCTSSPSVE